MSVNKRARCPLCSNEAGTFAYEGRRLYMHHLTDRNAPRDAQVECEATGWLVEDDELVVAPRRPGPLVASTCGTRAGYVRHVKAQQQACDACKAANSAYEMNRRRPPVPPTEETAP